MDEPARVYEPKTALCEPVREIFSLVGDKWTIVVLGVLRHERMRFKALHRAISGISPRVLVVSLRNLERDGLVLRTIYPTVPPRVEYELTARGHSLQETLAHVATWVHANQPAIDESRRHFDQQASAEPEPMLTKT
jgi:DNA-binding HxlR family transcriptional regulator